MLKQTNSLAGLVLRLLLSEIRGHGAQQPVRNSRPGQPALQL